MNRITTTGDLNIFAYCRLSGADIGLLGTFDLTVVSQKGGFSAPSNGLIFPKKGFYKVSCVGQMVRSSASGNDAAAAIAIRLGATVGNPSVGATVAIARGLRGNNTTSNEFPVSGQGVFEVTDLSDRLWASQQIATNITIPFSEACLIVEPIGSAT